MINNGVIVGITPASVVPYNKIELAARLGKSNQIDEGVVNQYIEKYNKTVNYRYAHVKIPYKYVEGLCCFEEKNIYSPTLAKVLTYSKEVILLAVTSGLEVDKLISKSVIKNPSEAFLIDAVASAGIESYMEYIAAQICKDIKVTNRFSPGYADFPLEFQDYLLTRLSAKENIGIMLSNDYFMTPTKSITAIIGIN